MESRREPCGRHRTMVSHGATKDPARTCPETRAPEARSTSIVPSRCMHRLRTAPGPLRSATRASASSASAETTASSDSRHPMLHGVMHTTATVAAVQPPMSDMATRLY